MSYKITPKTPNELIDITKKNQAANCSYKTITHNSNMRKKQIQSAPILHVRVKWPYTKYVYETCVIGLLEI